MSTIELQVAGEFTESDKKIYYADKHDLYFYRTKVSIQDTNITDSFHFLTSKEVEGCRLDSGEEFMLYESKPDIAVETYKIDNTNIVVPVELVEEHIAKWTRMFDQMSKMGKDNCKVLIDETDDTIKCEGVDDILNINDLDNMEAIAEGIDDIPNIQELANMIKELPEKLNIKQLPLVDEDDIENIVM